MFPSPRLSVLVALRCSLMTAILVVAGLSAPPASAYAYDGPLSCQSTCTLPLGSALADEPCLPPMAACPCTALPDPDTITISNCTVAFSAGAGGGGIDGGATTKNCTATLTARRSVCAQAIGFASGTQAANSGVCMYFGKTASVRVAFNGTVGGGAVVHCGKQQARRHGRLGLGDYVAVGIGAALLLAAWAWCLCGRKETSSSMFDDDADGGQFQPINNA